jgi:hypothetical protein
MTCCGHILIDLCHELIIEGHCNTLHCACLRRHLAQSIKLKDDYFLSSEQILFVVSDDHHDAHVYGNPCSYDSDNADDRLEHAQTQVQQNQKD